MDRRDFIKTAAVAAAIPLTARAGDDGSIRLSRADSEAAIIEKAVSLRPSPRQMAWQEREFTMFAHFGMNTFTNLEWGYGFESPRWFNPTALDAGQWAKTAREAGMKMIILTAKHHDGFCLWPSAYTGHSVKNSPWRKGKGDVVAEVASACRETGLKFGVYLSPWDRHEKTYGTPAYNDYYKSQLRELLTNYGEVAEIWMDGAGVGRKFKAMREIYDWEGIFSLARELAPDAVLSIHGPDVRWVGNEAGSGRESEWSVVPAGLDPVARDIGSRGELIKAAERGAELIWSPAQVDVSIRPGWFYHKAEDALVKSVSKLTDIYFDSIGMNAQLLLNVPPDRRGLLNENDVKSLMGLKRELDNIFSEDLASGARVTASSSVPGHGPESLTDGNPQTYWTTEDGVTSATLEIDLGSEKTFSTLMLMEPIASEGQRIEKFVVLALAGEWRVIAGGTTVGYKRLLRFEKVKAGKVRVRVLHSRIRPALSRVAVW